MYIAIATITALLAALWGWNTGFLRVVLRLSSLLLAYGLAWQETPHLAQYLSDKGWVSGMPAWVLAGLVLFVGGSIMFSVLARWLHSVAPEHWQRGGRGTGALAGLVLGLGVGVMLVWTVGALQDAWRLQVSRQPDEVTASEPVPEVSISALDRMNGVVRGVSGEAMAAVTQSVLGDTPGATVAAQWIRQPLSMSEGLQHLAAKPELRMLFQNPDHYAVMARGSAADIMALQPFQALVADPEVMTFLDAAGLPGDTLQSRSAALAELFSRYAQSFEKLRGTKEFQALIQDPELHDSLKQGNLLLLITNDKVRQIADMLAKGQLPDLPAGLAHQRSIAGNASASQQAERSKPASASKPVVASKPLYRWRDQSGHLHITEDPPPEGIPADVIKP